MSLESRVKLASRIAEAAGKLSEKAASQTDAAVNSEEIRERIPLFSVMPYSGGYRVWCPPDATFPYNGGYYPFTGNDKDGWINLGVVRGDVYAYLTDEKDGAAMIGMNVPDGSVAYVHLARIE